MPFDRDFSTIVGSNGQASVTLTPTKNVPWIVTQVSTEYRNSPSGSSAELRKNGSLVTAMIPTDVADSDPPVFLRPGDRLVVTWFGGTAGNPVSAIFFYEEGTYQ
jgi:hypothetical protein